MHAATRIRDSRRIVGAIVAIALVTVASSPLAARPRGRSEAGTAVRGVVALVEAASGPTGVYAGRFCGGAVIAPGRVLTAAHCVERRSASEIHVLAGADDICGERSVPPLRLPVVAISRHPLYDHAAARFDLAVLRLGFRLSPEEVLPIGSDGSYVGEATAFGWGALTQGGAAACRLMKTALVIQPASECPLLVGDGATTRRFDAASMLCALPAEAGAPDTCSGDSGGPLLAGSDSAGRELIGIVSWGRGCGNGWAGAYARAGVWAQPHWP